MAATKKHRYSLAVILESLGLRSDFNKNLLVLFSGTVMAQAIPLAASPILTRLYKPDEFGVYALFFSISNLLGIVANGRYEYAIVLPRQEADAENLKKLCYVISFGFGLLLLIVISLFHQNIVKWLSNDEIGKWLYFIPLSVFFTGIIQTVSYSLNRKRKFKHISYQKLTQTGSSSISSIVLGFLNFTKQGLIVGYLLGQFLAILFMNISEGMKFNYRWHDLKEVALAYKKFPLYNAPAALLNTAASSLPVFYLSQLVDKKGVGFYGLIERSIGAPISLVSYSLSQVLFEDIANRHRNQLPIRGRVLNLLKNLSLVGIIPFTLLFFFSGEIFGFIFGQEWAEAGSYASVLSIAFFFRFIVSPLSVILISLNRIKTLVLWQTSYFLSTVAVVAFSMASDIDTQTFFRIFTANDVLLYSFYLYLIIHVTKGEQPYSDDKKR